MDVPTLKKYLTQIATPGTVGANLDDMADVAVEAGFASVWGAYDWKVKRAIQTDVTMTSGQAYYELPADFDKIISIRVLNFNRPWVIKVMEEEEFDYNFPNPERPNENQPSVCKVVRHNDGTYRLYWWRIPNSAYSIEVTYDVRGSATILPSLPPHMVIAVVTSCSALMQGEPNARLAADENARRMMNQAIKADGLLSNPSLRQEVGSEWDDFALYGQRGSWHGGPVWQPHAPYRYF